MDSATSTAPGPVAPTRQPPPHLAGLVLDTKHTKQLPNSLRPDVCFDDSVAPAMPAPVATALMRGVLTDLLQSFAKQVPPTPEEQQLASAGDTLCGHMRQYHAEARAQALYHTRPRVTKSPHTLTLAALRMLCYPQP